MFGLMTMHSSQTERWISLIQNAEHFYKNTLTPSPNNSCIWFYPSLKFRLKMMHLRKVFSGAKVETLPASRISVELRAAFSQWAFISGPQQKPCNKKPLWEQTEPAFKRQNAQEERKVSVYSYCTHKPRLVQHCLYRGVSEEVPRSLALSAKAWLNTHIKAKCSYIFYLDWITHRTF